MAKIMVVAGEVSGDMQAARVIQALQKKDPTLTFVGMGGDEMRKAGVKIVFDPTQISTIGFVEALKHLRKLYAVLDLLSRVIDEEKPDLLFLVDYSAFNMKMAKIGQRKEVPVVNYFSPSAWVWGKWRAKTMAKRGARIAAVFPMEAKVYQEAGADVTFVGHPLLDFVAPEMSRTDFRAYVGVGEDVPLIGLLPGSRRGEIASLLPPMIEAAELIHARHPEFVFLLPVASPQLRAQVETVVGAALQRLPLRIIDGHAYEVMDNGELILCASGTATLEAACIGVPMVIVYITSWSTYRLSKVLAHVPFAGLPNIIAGRRIVPELLQEDVTGANIAHAALELADHAEKRDEMKRELSRVRQALGATGAVERVGDLILRVIGERKSEIRSRESEV